MADRRVYYGGCSFVPPDGFVLQKEASLPSPDTSKEAGLFYKRKVPVCITLTNTAVHPDVADISEFPEDMNPDAYPVILTLNTYVNRFTGSALHYLRNAGEVLKNHFTDFHIDFYEEDRVGEFPGARAQYSFVTHFKIFQLHVAWLAHGILATSTTIVTESGLKKGWADLRSFVETVRIDAFL
jgi:hypothetical protein